MWPHRSHISRYTGGSMTDDAKASAAAHVASMAVAADVALKKEAAHVAEAVIEVAAAAHESLAPSVLVSSMFETLQRQLAQVVKRMDSGAEWMMRTEREIGDIRHTGEKTYEQAQKTNGRMTEAEAGIAESNEWHAAHDKRLEAAALIAVGKHEVIGVPRVAVEATQTFLEKVWPLIVTAATCLVVGAVAVAAFTVSWWPW